MNRLVPSLTRGLNFGKHRSQNPFNACVGCEGHGETVCLRRRLSISVLLTIFFLKNQPCFIFKSCTFMLYLSRNVRFCHISHMRKDVFKHKLTGTQLSQRSYFWHAHLFTPICLHEWVVNALASLSACAAVSRHLRLIDNDKYPNSHEFAHFYTKHRYLVWLEVSSLSCAFIYTYFIA